VLPVQSKPISLGPSKRPHPAFRAAGLYKGDVSPLPGCGMDSFRLFCNPRRLERVEMVEKPLTHPLAQSCSAGMNPREPHWQRSAPQPTPAPHLAGVFVLRRMPRLRVGSVTRRDAPRLPPDQAPSGLPPPQHQHRCPGTGGGSGHRGMLPMLG